MNVLSSSSGPFSVLSRKRKMGQVDIKEDDEELQDMEVIWNKGFTDNAIEDESSSQQAERHGHAVDDDFYCVTPDRPHQLTRFQRKKVSSFLLEKESRRDEMCFYQFCVSSQDPKLVDVYKLSREPPSLKKMPSRHKSRKSRIKNKRILFKDLYSNDFH